MVYCAVFGCKNNSNKRNKNYTENNGPPRIINFFCFPQNKDLQKQWVFRCSRKEQFKIENARVCSDHFKNEDFMMKYDSKILGYTPKFRKLKPGAIPCLKLPRNYEEDVGSKRRDRVKVRTLKKTLFNKLSEEESTKNNANKTQFSNEDMFNDTDGENSVITNKVPESDTQQMIHFEG
ncbi:uncharacterized protein LOC123009964 [Tribolium madens]|uniref:uncharacterized protein LOC123009964 n=1 Tax=Tribolium madens TaxID=41895 RepID=UPI001CF72FE5|nr:uncharacterized protein LOC123009964 [Tribolium madens]